jgi:hypothetical protein
MPSVITGEHWIIAKIEIRLMLPDDAVDRRLVERLAKLK